MIQSVLGVGLLVFGTPSLLIYGLSFIESLMILLPCSSAISLLQLTANRCFVQKVVPQLGFYLVPSVGLGLCLILSFSEKIDLTIYLGFFMLLSVLLKLSSRANQYLSEMFSNNQTLFLLITGFIHGLSNMGGALLSVGASFLYEGKLDRRSYIASGYLIFTISQLAVLIIFGDQEVLSLMSLLLICIIASCFAYLFIDILIFHKMNESQYSRIYTIFLVFGVFLVARVCF